MALVTRPSIPIMAPGNPNLVLPCVIKHWAFDHFVGKDIAYYSCYVASDSRLNFQLCFFPTEPQWQVDSTATSEHVHVQLYSTSWFAQRSLCWLAADEEVELGRARHPFRISAGVCISPTASDVIDKIKSWTDTCVSSHPVCATDRAFVPTRVIELDERQTDTVRLSSPKAPMQWIALAYCWGTSQQSKTTKDDILTREHEIVVSDLPQTLRDDSSCIMQDDKNDWANEASKMANVYSGAWLVLAATKASDCASGLLHPRAEPFIIGPGIHGAVDITVHARRTEAHHCSNKTSDMAQYPLFQRVWW